MDIIIFCFFCQYVFDLMYFIHPPSERAKSYYAISAVNVAVITHLTGAKYSTQQGINNFLQFISKCVEQMPKNKFQER